MANTIKIKRGLSSNIDNTTLAQGELAITTDTQDLYVGTDSGNKKVGSGPKNLLDGNIVGSVRTSGSAEESNSYKLGQNAFAEGGNTKASGWGSHAEGGSTTASGSNSHAEGVETTASALGSHAEGIQTTASGWYSHAEGNRPTASGFSSHAEGDSTTASGETSHAEGFWTEAIEKGSHAEGYYAKASGRYSHAEGKVTTASGEGSHAEGYYAIASGSNSHVQGKYNIEDTENKYAHIVGNGTNEGTERSNAHTLDWQGNAWFAGDVYTGSTSGTNKDLGSKKLATEEYVTDSIGNIQETINIQKDSSITDAGVGKLDIASANIFTATTEPHFYKVGVADTTLYNGILYNGTVPFKNVTDDSLVRIQKDAVIYYAGGVAYCFTGEGIYSLLWDDTEKKGWVTKVKMDNESYHVYDQEIDTLPNITVTAGDFTWDATAKTLTVKGAKNTTKTATIKFNEDVDGVYYSLANSSLTTGRMGMLSVKINNEDYYIGLLQGFGTHYSQWNMKKNDVVTIEYTGDSTATVDDEFVFKIEHWQKPKQTTSVASYANYIVGNSELNDQMNESSLRTDVLNMKYDMDERHTHHYEAYRGNSLPTCTITNGTNGFSHPSNSVDFTATSADGMTYETTLTITQENMDAMGFLATITSSKESATWGECTLKIENTTQNRVLLETSEIGESRTIGGVNTGDSIKMTFTCPTSVNTPMEVTVSAIMYLTWETTSMVENVIHSVAAIEEFITDQKIDYLENELKHIKAEQKPQIHTGTYPNLQLNLNAASDNSEWRIWQGSQGNCTLTIGFDGSEIGEESTFGCTVVFKTPHRSTATTTFSWAADYGDMVSVVGDDVVDGIFTPQLLKVYEMVFTWNGFVMNCVVKGSKYTAPQE